MKVKVSFIVISLVLALSA